MKKTILYKTLFFCWAILALTGCDLDLQKNYDYEPSVDDPYVKVTAWEYFQDHKDMFSELIAAIEYTGLKDYYTQTDNKYTFLALNNAGMQLYRENEFAGAASITDCDKEKVTNMLLYHIVDGEYSSYGQLQVEPMFVLTMLKGENGLMTMSVWKNPWQAAVGKILVNQTGSNGKSPQRQAKTSNILPTNGKEKYLITKACEWHDVGKVNLVFQSIVNPNIHLASDVAQIPHGFLSALSVSKKKICAEMMGNNLELLKDDFRILVSAIYYHHDRDDVYTNNYIEKYAEKWYKSKVSEYLSDEEFKFMRTNRNKLLFSDAPDVRRSSLEIPEDIWCEYMLVKGMLNKFDWTVSSGYEEAELGVDICEKKLCKNIETKMQGSLRPAQEYIKLILSAHWESCHSSCPPSKI